MSAGLAPTLLPNPVALWHGSIEAISPHASPCRYLSPVRWSPMQENCLDFIAQLGAAAHQFGWTAAQLFAVHPEHGMLRLDFCGALMVTGDRVQAVEADRLVFERGSAFRTKPGQEWGVPVWEFARKGG